MEDVRGTSLLNKVWGGQARGSKGEWDWDWVRYDSVRMGVAHPASCAVQPPQSGASLRLLLLGVFGVRGKNIVQVPAHWSAVQGAYRAKKEAQGSSSCQPPSGYKLFDLRKGDGSAVHVVTSRSILHGTMKQEG